MKSPLPLPELFDEDEFSFNFKKPRGLNDAFHRRRPPKLVHPFNRSINASFANAISFIDDSRTELSTMYNRNIPDTYYEQCFEQLTKVGEGSFGEVFKVRSRVDGRLYAVKKSKAYFRSTQCRELCLEEVRRYEQFSDHENCVKLYLAWEQEDRLYMQMELCRENLEVYAREQQKLPDERIWSIMLDLLLALKSLHDRNLIHLDIKLDNILVTDDGTCKLADFGIVFDLTKSNPRYATEGDSRYMAPELMEGMYTKAADIFSLGIATLELACNLELPANGRLWQRLRSGQPLPENLACNISPALKTIIHSMMHPIPDERPTVDALLKHPIVHKVYEARRRRRVWERIKSYVHRKLSSLSGVFMLAVMWLVACIRLQHRKESPGVVHPKAGKTTNGYNRSHLFNGNCSGTPSRMSLGVMQNQSSSLLAGENHDYDDDGYDDLNRTGFDSSTCTTAAGDDTDCDRTTGTHDGTEKESIQITPTLNNSMPPTRTPTIRIVNSTPLNHDHLKYQHHLQYSHPNSHSHSGSRHTSRVFCSPFRILWFEDDASDLSILNESHQNSNAISTSSSIPPPPLNDSDNDFRPLGSPSHDLNVSSGQSEDVPANNVTTTSSIDGSEQSITSTPNSSLFKTMRTSTILANGLAAAASSGCDNPLSTGYSSFLIKKKLRFNEEEDDDSD
ncbi:membrane-associated tyrosine- and threonine-specific cdc2-inhibitory kinase wee-1.3 [Anopheles moucheti]|uniref:membrane-associated tyrosine- and threonine-specific cdc2-inhibitory kinase wee-1.3 n=1 Tax=Anopheles moucheti TaxID=186751 RepID=UPI0022F0641E|nr:membrane-associated tyrosine- and threonine-specific cdc2-inhibitory kinase wee-1.3 [Anopheles moucheti]XP_052888896.1 membrane-associated tyrosine- and threonine-specific cdc2-inhibitory kinase wee-1.3 [Anopheles moucheti]